MVKVIEGLLTSDQTHPGRGMHRADEHKLGSESFVNFGEDSCTARLHTCAALGFFLAFFPRSGAAHTPTCGTKTSQAPRNVLAHLTEPQPCYHA